MSLKTHAENSNHVERAFSEAILHEHSFPSFSKMFEYLKKTAREESSEAQAFENESLCGTCRDQGGYVVYDVPRDLEDYFYCTDCRVGRHFSSDPSYLKRPAAGKSFFSHSKIKYGEVKIFRGTRSGYEKSKI